MIFRNSTIPVPFIAGKSDPAMPLEDTLKQCRLPSLSYIHGLDNSGNMMMLEESGKCNLIPKKASSVYCCLLNENT
jgi:hypothetical protein